MKHETQIIIFKVTKLNFHFNCEKSIQVFKVKSMYENIEFHPVCGNKFLGG